MLDYQNTPGNVQQAVDILEQNVSVLDPIRCVLVPLIFVTEMRHLVVVVVEKVSKDTSL